MERNLVVDIPEPKYAIGATVIALINHQPRIAQINAAHLNPHFVLKADGLYTFGQPRWEYDVLVLNDPHEASEPMMIAESTVITTVQDSDDA